MFSIRISIVAGLLSLLATVGFAQSGSSQTVTIIQGATIKFTANSANASTYQWLKDGAMLPDGRSSTYMASTAGKYTVITYNNEGCASVPSDPVIVIVDQPGTSVIADMAITKVSELRAVSINDPFEYTLNVKNNGPQTANMIKVQDVLPIGLTFESLINPLFGTATYNLDTRTITWNILQMENSATADLKIKVKTNKYGIYRNTATVTANETDPILTNNAATDVKPVLGITIPNVFTPNGDGKNDTFEIVGLNLYETNEIKIINRWQGTVYEKKGYQNDWRADGLNDGTYFYVLKIKTPTNTWQEFKGYVTVIH